MHSIYRLSHLDGALFYVCLRCGVWVKSDRWPGEFQGSCDQNLRNFQGHEFGEPSKWSVVDAVLNGDVSVLETISFLDRLRGHECLQRIQGNPQKLESRTICCIKCRETALELKIDELRWISATRGNWEHSCNNLTMKKVLG